MTRQIFAAEINFEDTPLTVREKFNDSEINIKRLLGAFRSRVDEVFILATGQRFTVYVVHESLEPLTSFFHKENNLKGYVQFYYNTGESITHMMATASGLLSRVKGDARIMTQMIQCYHWATACGCVGILLDSALSRVIDTGKSVRTQTGIDKFCASVVETGIELLYNRLDNLHTKNFLIVGTGKMAQLALEYLTREGFRHIALTGKNEKKVLQLAKQFGVRSFGIEFLTEYFLKADVIIGVADDELKHSIPRDTHDDGTPGVHGKNRFVLDFGIPPNFDMEMMEMYAEEFYNLDDLRRLEPTPLEAFGGLEAAWRMVMKASADFVLLLQLLNHSPVLTAYLTRQFIEKNGELKVKPKRTLRNMLLFRKADGIAGSTQTKEYINARQHVNNYVAENGQEVVRNTNGSKNFKFILSDN